ncbi:MAG: dTDP-4-dehydrorhamnose reductase [Candidatus Alcyoniella australis]|nr:dTDP-4-dehydrorhamnose reductase [Candidatus Alcyoniella australis]
MRCLVLGCNGMLGRRVVEAFAAHGHELCAMDLPEVDITDPQSVEAALRFDPQWVINCAAYTAVDQAEDQPDAAMRVNAQGPRVLAAALAERSTRLLHISTDYVFDGTKPGPYCEDDRPQPLGAYARSKLAGETALSVLGQRATIVRTAWLYGPDGGHFFRTIVRLARERGELSVVEDQRGTPTLSNDLAAAILELCRSGRSGLFHATNSGVTTWYEAAKTCCEILGINITIRPVKSSQMPRKAPRPANSELCCDRLAAALGGPLRPWREALECYLTKLEPALRENK